MTPRLTPRSTPSRPAAAPLDQAYTRPELVTSRQENTPNSYLITEGSRRDLSAWQQRDWGALLLAQGGELTAWRTLEPMRYALLCLTLIGAGALYQQLSFLLMGLGLSSWVTRRVHLIINVDGVTLRCSTLGLTYRARTLPLESPLKLIEQGSISSLWLGDAQTSALPVELLVCRQERGERCQALLLEAVRRAQARRLSDPRPHWVEGEGVWLLSLIELLPVLAPKMKRQPSQLTVSWWSPATSLWLNALIALTLSPLLLIFSPSTPLWLITLVWCLALTPLVTSREVLERRPEGVVWCWSVCGLAWRRQVWRGEPTLSLQRDALCPAGRAIVVYSPQDPSSARLIGHPWDCAWLWRALHEPSISAQ